MSEDDIFTASLIPGENEMNLTVTGTKLRCAALYQEPYLSCQDQPGQVERPPKGQNFVVDAKFESVTAHRGEVIRDVKANFCDPTRHHHVCQH